MGASGVRRVAVLGGNRIPFARADGPYATASDGEMLAAALEGLVERFGLRGELLGEFVAGAVLKHSRDFQLARETVLGSALDHRTPAFDVQQACGTGLEAVILVANKIALGQIDAGVAGGVDTASDVPLALDDGLRRLLLRARRERTPPRGLRALAGLRPRHLLPEIPRNAEPRTGLPMGEHAARTAAAWGVTRADQDAFAAASHRRLAAAYARGFFDDLLTPFRGLDRDQNLRPDSTPEQLAALRPVFGVRQGDGGEGATMTAGNSTPLTDGAATVLLASEEWAAERRLPVLAYLTHARTAAVDFVEGDDGPDGLLMAPAYAVPRLLDDAGLGLADLDVLEIHEAFAAQVLATLAAWEDPAFGTQRLGLPGAFGAVDRARINPMGSSLATGHPFAATGGRIVATLAKELHERAGERGGGPVRGLVSVCAAGGVGVTAILESRQGS
ncbi:acetyl-CoA C-acetyltransferase [Streptomyces radicis]|uniref:Acetyl-CoA C-acetyltransferase n=1 Tax=Streptomyces radicis TaxID=1750517 RepID=A0A3A9W3P2_9ACTN|nr:acetyl-CoA C-acetyltransferase [Streptomyces radicis]RKN03834.1 acetyl-CoA C-acetyltransferase [Streptomyces radicis]RKN13927.1 acetyl-CoA C-acetyltransferase [Streptomyces radicis]